MLDNQEFKPEGQKKDKTCPATGYQSATVCVPVTIRPFAKPGKTTTYCKGNPIIKPDSDTCHGTINGVCNFTISQEVCVEVPVDFGATATVGKAVIDCGKATCHNICKCHDFKEISSDF